MIKYLFFDQGEVLFTNDWDLESEEKDRKFYSHYHLDPQNFWKVRNEVIKKLFLGRMSEREYWHYVLTKTHASTNNVDFAISLARSYQQWKPGMQQLLVDLHSSGLILAMITTTHKEMLEFKKVKFQIDEYFSYIISSCETGLMKPDPEIFRLALKRVGGYASECIFIDDMPNNADAAFKLGIQSIVFENSLQCREELIKLGVHI